MIQIYQKFTKRFEETYYTYKGGLYLTAWIRRGYKDFMGSLFAYQRLE